MKSKTQYHIDREFPYPLAKIHNFPHTAKLFPQKTLFVNSKFSKFHLLGSHACEYFVFSSIPFCTKKPLPILTDW